MFCSVYELELTQFDSADFQANISHPSGHSEYQIVLQRICYAHWANGAQNGMKSIWQWGAFNQEKGTI